MAQVQRRDVVAELADVARQREARLVVAETDLAALGLHADNLERQLTCEIASKNLCFVELRLRDAPLRLLAARLSVCRFVRLPIVAGTAPARNARKSD